MEQAAGNKKVPFASNDRSGLAVEHLFFILAQIIFDQCTTTKRDGKNSIIIDVPPQNTVITDTPEYSDL